MKKRILSLVGVLLTTTTIFAQTPIIGEWITVDDATLEQGTVTVRDRDTMEQIRIPMDQLRSYIEEKMQF